MGKACFMNVQDEKGKIQLYIKNDIVGIDRYDSIVRKLDIGDIIDDRLKEQNAGIVL